ncbi:MAG: hypothetical protein GXO26_08200 [Crenarchaeota archaeon]|nr:hypothetical protein [Thermoproteota archaeon]
MTRRIIIRIKDGKVDMDFQGFIGPSCFREHDKIRQILEKMGIKYEDIKTREKPEAKMTVGEKHDSSVNY